MHIEVVRENESKLKRDVWRFYYLTHEHTLVCQSWAAEARESRRHRYRAGLTYARLDPRRSSEQSPPMPLDVADEAAKQFYLTLKIQPEPQDV